MRITVKPLAGGSWKPGVLGLFVDGKMLFPYQPAICLELEKSISVDGVHLYTMDYGFGYKVKKFRAAKVGQTVVFHGFHIIERGSRVFSCSVKEYAEIIEKIRAQVASHES